MNALREVAIYHFKREVFKKSYIMTLLSLPLFLALSIGLGMLIARVKTADIRIGVVDPAGFFRTTSLEGREDTAELVFIESRDAAENMLREDPESLQAIYILPADYPQSRDVEVLYHEFPPSSVQDYIVDILRYNLLEGQPEALRSRLIDGQEMTLRASSVNREYPAGNPTAELFIPLILAVIYIFTIVPVAGIMVGALGDEKINRTIEVIVTSISPRTMIQGKILAVSGIALLQVTVWVFFFITAAWISGAWFDMAAFQDITVHWRDVGAIVSLAIPGFVFYSAVLVMIGSLIDDAESLQQIGGLVFFPLFLPIYVLPVIMEQPNSTLALVFSFLPFTSVQTVGLQSLFMEVPFWRIAASTGASWLIAAGTVWLASRAFRLGMLRYGKRLRLKDLFGKAPASQRTTS